MQYVALFAGPNLKQSRLVCAVVDPNIIATVAKAGLQRIEESPDPVLAHLAAGNRGALKEILRGTATVPRRGSR